MIEIHFVRTSSFNFAQSARAGLDYHPIIIYSKH